jgi:hypothetical protein
MTKKILKTEKMPSGAQQWVRGDKAHKKMEALQRAIPAAKEADRKASGGKTTYGPRERAMNKAFIDVADKSSLEYKAKRQSDAARKRVKDSIKAKAKAKK